MYTASIHSYDGELLETVEVAAQTFVDANIRATRYANENIADWDHLFVHKF